VGVKKRFTGEQIIGFLRKAEAGMAVKELCERHGFSDASCQASPNHHPTKNPGSLRGFNDFLDVAGHCRT
jgi:hypothetical protein